MLSKEEKERYSRHIILEGFGEAAQLKLKSAKVLVIGAGGLGCPALLYLTAAGVGTIGIMDDDVVSESNLQRQVLFSLVDIGKKKSLIAKEKLQKQNPFININVYDEKVTKNNALSCIKNYDLVIDGSDNFATRYLVNDACIILNKPFVYGAIHKFEGQVSVFNFKGGPTYRCLFAEPPLEGEMLSCSEAGVLGILPGVIGNLQATEAIKLITGIGEPLSGKLLSINLLNYDISVFEFEAIPDNKLIRELGNYEISCRNETMNYESLISLQKKQKVQLIDVREKDEFETKNLNGINIPLREISTRINELNPGLITVVHCKSGIRSQKAINIIKQYYPKIEIYNLYGYDLN